MRTLSAFLSPLVLIAVLLAGWEFACARLAVPAYLLPPPSAIWTALLEGWPLLLASAWGTLSTALLALVIASLLACALALTVSLSTLLEDAVRPIAVTLQVTPLVARSGSLDVRFKMTSPTLTDMLAFIQALNAKGFKDISVRQEAQLNGQWVSEIMFTHERTD